MSATAPKTIARYQVLNHLGTGGMGSVFLARDPALGRLVAIKLLREGFDSPELRERFEREARSAGRLRHTNIVTVFDVGEHGNEPFIAMEYVEGETLSKLIRDPVEMSLGRKLRLMDDLCAGLHYAHRAGIVHRDIKPENIMVDNEGVVKVLDFGIARISDAGGGAMKTKAGMLMGTLNYMAPEQMMGLPDVDSRADIFAAGAVFYELLTGEQAFPGGLESGILNKIININPEPLEVLKPGLDAALIEIVNRCLEKSRDKRYHDLGEVRRHLHPLLRRHPIEETIVGTLTAIGAFPIAEVKTVALPKPDDRNLERLRTEQIRSHLDNARKALTEANFTLALEASQCALLLDAAHRDALELEARARAGLKAQQLAQCVTSARRELERGALTSAALLVDEAFSLNPSSTEAAEMRALLNDARRQLAEAEERRRKRDVALTAARDDLSSGDFTAAAAHVDEALAMDPGNAAALAIQAEITAALEQRRRAEEEARARTAIDEARRRFAAGDHPGAIAALERFDPRAPVAEGLEELRVEFREIERLRIEAERQEQERRKASEAAAAQRKAKVKTGLATARAGIDAGRFEDALRALADVEALDASTPDLITLRHAAAAGIQAAEAAAARQRDIEERLARADRSIQSRDWAKGLEHVASALKLDPANTKAKALESRIQAALLEQRAKEQREQEQREKEQRAKEQREKEQREKEQRAKEQREKEQREKEQRAKEQREKEEREKEQRETARRDKERREKEQAEEAARSQAALQKQREAEQRRREEEEKTRVVFVPSNVPLPLSAPALLTDVPPAIDPSPDALADRAGSSNVIKYAAFALVVVVALAVSWWFLGRTSSPVAATEAGTAILDILPWATIESITLTADGTVVQTDCPATPCVLSLPAGQYHVRAVNPNFPGTLEFDVTVEARGVREERRSFPGFNPEGEVANILENKK